MTDKRGELADRLESVAAELDDYMFDLLHEAAAAGATRRPPDDKQLLAARRAIDKAISLLRGR